MRSGRLLRDKKRGSTAVCDNAVDVGDLRPSEIRQSANTENHVISLACGIQN